MKTDEKARLKINVRLFGYTDSLYTQNCPYNLVFCLQFCTQTSCCAFKKYIEMCTYES